jgi:hypothetical protein
LFVQRPWSTLAEIKVNAITLMKLRVLICLSCALVGCGGVDPIEMSGDPALVPAFTTYRIHEEQLAFATEVSEADRTKVATTLRDAVTQALNSRGYKESDQPDVLVSLGAASRATFAAAEREGPIRNVDPSVLEPGRLPSAPSSEITPSGVGREGDLFLYLLDPKTKRVVWRASTSGSATTASEAMRRARSTYGAMIAKLPKAGASTKS